MLLVSYVGEETVEYIYWRVNVTGTVSVDLDDIKSFPGVDLTVAPSAFASFDVDSEGGWFKLNEPVRVSVPFSFAKLDADTDDDESEDASPEFTVEGVAEFSIPCESKIEVNDVSVSINTGGLKVDEIKGSFVKYCTGKMNEESNVGAKLFEMRAEVDSLESINGFSIPSASLVVNGYDVGDGRDHVGGRWGIEALLTAQTEYDSSSPNDLLVHTNVYVSNVEMHADGSARLMRERDGSFAVIAEGNLTYSRGWGTHVHSLTTKFSPSLSASSVSSLTTNV